VRLHGGAVSFYYERLILTRDGRKTLTELSAGRGAQCDGRWLEWLNTKVALVDDPPLKRIVGDPERRSRSSTARIRQRADVCFLHSRLLVLQAAVWSPLA